MFVDLAYRTVEKELISNKPNFYTMFFSYYDTFTSVNTYTVGYFSDVNFLGK